MSKRHYTKRPMIVMSSVRLPTTDVALLREAAAQHGISQSEFVRVRSKNRRRGHCLNSPHRRPPEKNYGPHDEILPRQRPRPQRKLYAKQYSNET
jgi:hypothetical protein